MRRQILGKKNRSARALYKKLLKRTPLTLISVILICLSIPAVNLINKNGRPNWPELKLLPQDRILVLAPHPDDEVIGCGGLIQSAVSKGLPVRVVFFTYGDSYNLTSKNASPESSDPEKAESQGSGLMRQEEAIAAAKILGLSANDIIFLGYPDITSIMIWIGHWDAEPPLEDMRHNRAAVSYTTAFRPNAPYKGDEIVKDLTSIIREFRPTKVFCSSRLGDHSDHRALHLFTRIALWDLEKEITPEIHTYLTHFYDWPESKGYYPNKYLTPPDQPSYMRTSVKWKVFYLTSEQRDKKLLALKAHRSQFNSSSEFLLSFVRRNELFGYLPAFLLSPDKPFSASRKSYLLEKAEDLNDEERESFSGIEERHIQIENDSVVFSAKLLKSASAATEISFYLFGYRPDVPFFSMPKLTIMVRPDAHKVFNQRNVLPEDSVNVIYEPRKITVKVPLALLGHPKRIITSAFLHGVESSEDRIPWRIMEISSQISPRE